MSFEIRELKKEDMPELENIIRKTWNYDRFAGSKTAKRLARVFLISCLTNQTFSRVALLEGKPVGIILAKNGAVHKCPFSYRWQQICAIASVLFTREGRKVSKIFQGVNGVDKELLKRCKTLYPAELALFAVDASCRGKGIGKLLFQEALSYMKEQKLPRFYLYTDTSCNYGFYEHQGMVRRQEQDKVFFVNGEEAKMTFFIYDYEMTF